MSNQTAAKSSREWLAPWLLLVAATALGAVLVSRGPSERRTVLAPAHVDPLSVVPAGPELLLSVDVGALVESAGSELLKAGGAQLLGLRELCGFEPVLGLRRVVLALPPHEPGRRGAPGVASGQDFAVIAETSLEPEAMLRCAEQVIRKRGGSPVRSRLGQFWAVRDQRKPAGEMAVRADGLFVLSGGAYLRSVLDTAAGATSRDEPALLRSELHQAVRGKLGPGQVQLSLLEGAIPEVPSLRAAGLTLRVESQVTLRGFVGCASRMGCADLAALLQSAARELASEPDLAALGTIKVSQREAELELSGSLPRAELGRLLARLSR